MVDENVKKIGDLFPNCITETKDAQGRLKRSIKWDVLKETLSGESVEGGERYEFMWPGKKAAYAEAMRSIRKTLRPCKEESKNWDSTENLYIEGDNLEVLKLLQESYLGKVKMIYIDPPYNTGHDFVYRDNFQRSQQEENTQLGLFDEDESMLFENTESNGRFHSDWCSMIYSRLMLARNLLSDDGVIFVSIDDGELNNLKKLCDEVFGEENSQGILIWKTNPTFHVRNESPRFARAFVRFLELSNKGLHYTPADAVCAASELTFGGGCAGSVSPSWFKRILTSSFGST